MCSVVGDCTSGIDSYIHINIIRTQVSPGALNYTYLSLGHIAGIVIQPDVLQYLSEIVPRVLMLSRYGRDVATIHRNTLVVDNEVTL